MSPTSRTPAAARATSPVPWSTGLITVWHPSEAATPQASSNVASIVRRASPSDHIQPLPAPTHATGRPLAFTRRAISPIGMAGVMLCREISIASQPVRAATVRMSETFVDSRVHVCRASRFGMAGSIARSLKPCPAMSFLDRSGVRGYSPTTFRPGMSALLEIKEVSKSFGGVQAVSRVSLDVRQGEILSIIGPNGAGKTSLVNMIGGFYHPNAGRIALEGRDITDLAPNRIAELGVARTFQNIALFRGMTVLDNLMLGRHVR